MLHEWGAAWLAGFSLCFSLIVSIGAQNLFLLRQAVRGQYAWECALFCIFSDAMLMTVGVGGMAQVVQAHVGLAWWLGWMAVAFLLGYGLFAIRRAFVAQGALEVDVADGAAAVQFEPTRMVVLGALAAITFLNPHVYLDTVLLLGTTGAREQGLAKWVFVAGAVSASVVWFASLAALGRRLRRFFASARAWRALDALTGAMMLALAAWVWAGLEAIV